MCETKGGLKHFVRDMDLVGKHEEAFLETLAVPLGLLARLTSLIRNSPPPQDHHRTLCIVLL